MVEQEPSKLNSRVPFPSPAPSFRHLPLGKPFRSAGRAIGSGLASEAAPDDNMSGGIRCQKKRYAQVLHFGLASFSLSFLSSSVSNRLGLQTLNCSTRLWRPRSAF